MPAFAGFVVSQEIEESAGDCDFAVLVCGALDDDNDHLNDTDNPADEEQPENELDDSGNGPSVEEFTDPCYKEQYYTIQDLVDFVHIGHPYVISCIEFLL